MVFALIGAIAGLVFVAGVVITLERHHKLTVVTGAISAVSAAAIVIGSTLGVAAGWQPDSGMTRAPKFVSDNNLPERVVDFQLPTI